MQTINFVLPGLIGESVRCFCLSGARVIIWQLAWCFVKRGKSWQLCKNGLLLAFKCDDSQMSKCVSKLIGLTLRGPSSRQCRFIKITIIWTINFSLRCHQSSYPQMFDDEDKVLTLGYNRDAIMRNKQHNSLVWNRLTAIVQWLFTATLLHLRTQIKEKLHKCKCTGFNRSHLFGTFSHYRK